MNMYYSMVIYKSRDKNLSRDSSRDKILSRDESRDSLSRDRGINMDVVFKKEWLETKAAFNRQYFVHDEYFI